MIALLASIAGFISSLIPEIVRIYKDKNDKKHELEILSKQIEFTKMNLAQKIEEVKTVHDVSEFVNLYSTYKTGICWVDALNGTVRPVMAYCFFGLYALLKYTQYKAIMFIAEDAVQYIEILWTTDDQAIFAGIISFYFGQRTFSKLWRQR